VESPGRVTNNDPHHVALPKLYGAPAYARPSAPVDGTDRPFDPDDLPIEAERTQEEQELIQELAARPYAGTSQSSSAAGSDDRAGGAPGLRARPFRLGAITRRLRPPAEPDR
jgi:hypothetical protein